MEKNITNICRKLFFKTGKIGYYILANELERENQIENLSEEEYEL